EGWEGCAGVRTHCRIADPRGDCRREARWAGQQRTADRSRLVLRPAGAPASWLRAAEKQRLRAARSRPAPRDRGDGGAPPHRERRERAEDPGAPHPPSPHPLEPPHRAPTYRSAKALAERRRSEQRRFAKRAIERGGDALARELALVAEKSHDT